MDTEEGRAARMERSQVSPDTTKLRLVWVETLWLTLFVFLLLPYLQVLAAIWMGDGSRSASSLVAFLGFLGLTVLASRRSPPRQSPKRVAPALLLLVGASFLYVSSVGHDVVVGMGLCSLCLWSLLLYLKGGYAWLWVMRYPLALYLLAIPMPGFFVEAFTRGLLTAATAISAEALSWFLADVSVQGFHIDFETGSIAIVSSCSGLSGILLLIPLSIIFASLFKPVGWMRLSLGILLALALAFASNLFRILATAFLVHWDSSLGTSVSAHEIIGSIPLVLSLGVLIYYFYRSTRPVVEEESPGPGRSPVPGMTGLGSSMVVGTTGILVIACLLLIAGESRTAERRFDFAGFEASVRASFDGADLDKVRFEAENLLPDGYLCLEQPDQDSPFFSVYVGYFPREALVEKAQHDPRLCYATLGWEQIGEVTHRTFTASSGRMVEVRKLVFRANGVERVVWFWMQRGDSQDSEEQETHSIWDLLWASRSDSAWARIELDPILTGPAWEAVWGDRILDLRDAVKLAMN